MSEKSNGGPAFPLALQDGLTSNCYTDAGMSLRDWFAGMAMTGLCSHPRFPSNAIPREAYTIADAMLAAREAGDE